MQPALLSVSPTSGIYMIMSAALASFLLAVATVVMVWWWLQQFSVLSFLVESGTIIYLLFVANFVFLLVLLRHFVLDTQVHRHIILIMAPHVGVYQVAYFIAQSLQVVGGQLTSLRVIMALLLILLLI